MRYAIIENGKVVDIVSGVKPVGGIEIKQKWSVPSDYPSSFYYFKSSRPSYILVDGEVHEHNEVRLKPLSALKTSLYDKNKKIRQSKQLGSFDFGGTEIFLKDREDSFFIASLDSNSPLRMKVAGKKKGGKPSHVSLGSAEITALKAAHQAHVQAAYDWEEDENEIIDAFTTYEEVADYVE